MVEIPRWTGFIKDQADVNLGNAHGVAMGKEGTDKKMAKNMPLIQQWQQEYYGGQKSNIETQR